MAQTALRPAVVDFVAAGDQLRQPRSVDGGGARSTPASPLVGQTIRRGEHPAAVRRHRRRASSATDGAMEFNPEPEAVDSRRRRAGRARPAEIVKALEEAASLYDGARCSTAQALASQIREESCRRSRRSRRAHGRPPGLGHRARRRRPGVRGLRPQQAEVGGARPACAPISSACRRPRRWPTLLALVERLNRSDVHDGILVQSPLPDGDGRTTPSSGCSTRLRRRRTSTASAPVNVGRLVQNRPTLVACTPSGVIELLEREGDPDRRPARRRHRPQRHRRQADGAAAAAPRRDGDDLPLADARIWPTVPARRTSWWRPSAGRAS